MRRLAPILVLVLLAAGTLYPQAGSQPPEFPGVVLTAPAPPAPDLSLNYLGDPGTTTRCYRVAANYAGGISAFSGAVCYTGLPPSAVHSTVLSWTRPEGALSFDLVRLTSASQSLNCADCLIADDLNQTTLTDAGAAGTSYSPANPQREANATISVDDRHDAQPYLDMRLRGVHYRIPFVRWTPSLSGRNAAFDATGRLVEGSSGGGGGSASLECESSVASDVLSLATPCRTVVGQTIYTQSAGEIDLASGTGDAYIYADEAGQLRARLDGTLAVDSCTTVVCATGATGFPEDATPIEVRAATAGVWSSSISSDGRTDLRRAVYEAGTGISRACVAGVCTFSSTASSTYYYVGSSTASLLGAGGTQRRYPLNGWSDTLLITESDSFQFIPSDGTLTNFRMAMQTAVDNTSSCVIRVNSASSALSIVFTNDGTLQTVVDTDTVAVSAADTINLQCRNDATSGSAGPRYWSVELQL